MLTIYGHSPSSNVRKVLWACHELGLSYSHRAESGAQLIRSMPSYRALNPNGMVPTIDDDGFVLWESNAIVRYLTAKHRRDDLLPGAAQERAIVEQWMDWQTGDFKNAWKAAYNGLVHKVEPLPSDDAVESSKVAWAGCMRILEDRLAATGSYVASNSFTVADIVIGIAVNRWFMTPMERPRLPHVENYYERLTEREGYRLYGRNGMP